MARLRKKLPENFNELLEQGDIEVLKAVYDKCELNAYGGYSKDTALHFENVPEELVRFLVLEKGLDINCMNQFYMTPLHSQAGNGGACLKLLIELGADINKADNLTRETPLHIAANRRRPDSVKILLENGADMYAKNWNDENPLESALHQCMNIDIVQTVTVAEVFLEAGIQVTDKMKEYVKKIGESFEFYRDNFNSDYMEETEKGLGQLYTMFSVPPVPPRKRHDGTSTIPEMEGPWYKQHDELWNLLVPGKGHAATVQGEVIRISGKVAYEVMDNGGINWDSDYRKMLKYLVETFATGQALGEEELAEANQIEKLISKSREADREPERLMELAVKWVSQNREPNLIGKVEYRR